MNYHLRNKHPDLIDFQSSKTKDISESEGVHRSPRLKMVRFVVLSDQAFKIVEDESLRDLFYTLNPIIFTTQLKIRDATLKNDIMNEYKVELENVTSKLRQVRGQFSFTHDCWTSKNMIPFIAVTAHWVDDVWAQHDLLIGFMYFPGRHTGKHICGMFLELLSDRDINKVLGVTMDNASNNDTFTVELERRSMDEGFRCFAHVLNIAVQDMLKVLKVEANHDTEYDLSVWEENQTTGISVGAAVAKIRRIASAVRLSHMKEVKFMELNGLPELKLILDVKTRWNSTYAMISRAKMLRPSLDAMIGTDKDFESFRLSDEEWLLIAPLENVLKDFDFATNRISQAKYPTASLTMPMYKWLMDKLEISSKDQVFPLRDVCAKALDKISEYFKYSDQTGLWVVMAMNPTLKLEWMKDHFNKSICRKVKNAVVTVFTTTYEDDQNPDIAENALPSTSDNADILALYPKRGKKWQKGAEILKYLRADVAPPHADILQWWKIHEPEYKQVAMMARDYLAIPGSSVPAERIFSRGSDVITAKRRSLKPETISAILCLKNWWKQ